ncbi:MAG TPA: beta-propeller fold lactonase family protein [Candidatus Binataceae bacterium]|nr:beta-propeller fold lactonase family protein [Candidatus Binataceae bacterium]
MLTATVVACGKGIFPGASSSSGSSGGGGGSGIARSVYVSNFATGKLSALSLNTSTGALQNPVQIGAGAAKGPLGLATLFTTALYAANAADNEIHVYSLSTNGNLSSLGTIAAGTAPQAVAVTTSGNYAYAANKSSASISQYVIDTSTGALTSNGSTNSGPLVTPISLVATDFFVYVTDLNGGAGVVWTYSISSLDGTLLAGPSATPSLGGAIGSPAVPGQLVLDSTGTFVFVGDASGNIASFEASGTTLAFLAKTATGAGTNVAPAGLAFASDIGGNDYLYCANPSANSISVLLWNPTTLSLTASSITTSAALSSPTGVALSTSTGTDYLYVTNAGNGTVTQFTINTANGALTETNTFAIQSPANSASQPMTILINE